MSEEVTSDILKDVLAMKKQIMERGDYDIPQYVIQHIIDQGAAGLYDEEE